MLFLVAVQICALTDDSFAEKWVEFHSESWNHASHRLNKKLRCSSKSYYDDTSLKRDANGNVSVWTRDVSLNDRFYVGKGIPEKEVVYKQILLRCKTNKYEVILGDGSDIETQETVSEEIRSGSVYEKLYRLICTAPSVK
jgi:hypothetical protein